MPYQSSKERRSSNFTISECQTAYFREFGFVALDHITSSTEVASLKAAIERLFETKTGFREGTQFNLLGTDDDADAPSLLQLLMPHEYFGELLETEFFVNALAVALHLLGERAQFIGDSAILKPAINGPATPWHQDEAYRNPAFEHEEISVWLPLQPVNESTGCMAFIPKSHLGDVVPHRRAGPETDALECIEVDNDRAVICPIPVGACTVHAGRTIHGSGPNLANQARYAYILMFSLPPVRSRRLRQFPWLNETPTPRMLRQRTWERKDGVMKMLERKIKRKQPADYLAVLRRQVWTLRHWIIMQFRR